VQIIFLSLGLNSLRPEYSARNYVHYLGVYIVSSQVFKCSLQHAKNSFYKGANAIFGKLGRIASEEVALHLIERKCLPLLLLA